MPHIHYQTIVRSKTQKEAAHARQSTPVVKNAAERIRAIEGNKKCADCSAPSTPSRHTKSIFILSVYKSIYFAKFYIIHAFKPVENPCKKLNCHVFYDLSCWSCCDAFYPKHQSFFRPFSYLLNVKRKSLCVILCK